MLDAYCLGSSSSGNAYIFKLSDNEGFEEQILVECGLPYKELIRRAVGQGLRLSETQACLITHMHNDHAYAIREVASLCPVFTSLSTFNAKRILPPHSSCILKDWQMTYITPHIKVLPFKVEHDCDEPFGFIIKGFEETILFVNDSKAVTYDLSDFKFTYCFVECNYEDKFVHIEYNNALKSGNRLEINRYNRIMNSHMGLYGTKKLLKSLDLNNCKGIFLMHLSDMNAREREMKKQIGLLFPAIPIYCCRKLGGFQ